ncbi:PilZ domain-containing protein [Oryzomonas rubra]|uniref:PilZ domain-containing protein n=1 Tax=Oryzomonas rubra TaxID=2509454 RepID=A0A5A9XMK2_9BACT|nr:PilZ domain-containing protein [Oryzomonas rubra]KAA0894306.1 PilZ domain-containing protein [Oryzomonas rubra]
MTVNTRKFTRVEISAVATIECHDQTISGEITEISLRGLFIKTAVKLPVNQQVYVKAHCLKKEFQFPATVIYEQEQGLGLKIDEINLPSFFHLRELIASKMEDPDAVIQETFIMADIITG